MKTWKNIVPRQLFWDPVKHEWVRNTELILDEMRQVGELRNTWQAKWLPWVHLRLSRMHDALYAEYKRLGTGIVHTNTLRPGETQVAVDGVTFTLYPNHPYFWKKKKE